VKKPGVSIVMCTYNGEAYLQQQLESSTAQTFVAQEVIIVEDASTDNTWSLRCIWKKHRFRKKIRRYFYLFLGISILFLAIKKRFLPVFSYLKNAIKYAKAGYHHSGVSF
jgi:cation transport ATPase